MSSFTVVQASWRWYTDATPDGSMVPLAAENTAPTLTAAQMQNGKIRLRVQIHEVGGKAGSAAPVLFGFSADNWTNNGPIENETPTTNGEGVWFRWANGAATADGTLGSLLLTGSTEAGLYHESGGAWDNAISAGAVHEIDIAMLVHWPPPNNTIQFRVVYNGSELALDSGASYPTLYTSSAADRPYSIIDLPWDTSYQTSREVRFASWQRMFYDESTGNYWFFTVRYDTPTVLRSYYWTGSGGWTAGATFTCSSNLYQSRHALTAKMVSGSLHIYAHLGSSSSTRYFVRGTISGTTLTWGSEQSLSQATDRHCHIAVDDGGYVWIGGITASTGIWVRRATSVDSVSAWDSVITASNTGVVSGDVFTLVGLTSNKVMALWTDETADDLMYSIITTSATTPATVNATTNAANEDWGVARGGGYVYVVHSDSISSGGNWVLRVWDESGSSWSTGTSPSVSGQPSDNDGISIGLNGDDLYAVGTFSNTEGGQDRKLQYKKYTGPGASGSWGSLTNLTPTESRGNGDHLAAPCSGGGKLIWPWEFGDDNNRDGTGFVVEYHYLTLAVTEWLDGQSDGAAAVSGSLSNVYGLNGQSDGVAGVSGTLSKDVPLTGQSDGVASVSGSLSRDVAFAGQSDGVGAVTGSLTVTADKMLDGLASGVASVIGQISVDMALAGQSDGVSAVSGALSADRALTGQSDGISAVSGSLSDDIGLNGQSDGVSGVSGTLSRDVFLTGQSDGVSSVTGDVTTTADILLDGQADGLASVSGSLSNTLVLNGQTDGVAGVSGTLSNDIVLNGQADGVAAVTGDLTVTAPAVVALDGLSSGAAAVTGSLAPDRFINGQVNGSSSVTGSLTIQGVSEQFLDGQADGVSTVSGSLSLEVSLSTQVNGGATVSGILSPDLGLNGQADGQSSVSGALTTERNLIGQADGASLVSGSLSPDRNLTGQSDGQSTVSGSIVGLFSLAGQSDGVSAVSGSLTVEALAEVLMAGQSHGVTTVSGNLSLDQALAGQCDGGSTVSGTLSVDVALNGTSQGTTATNADILCDRGLTGQSDGVTTITGTLRADVPLSGSSAGVSTVGATLLIDVGLSGQSDGVTTTTASLAMDFALAGQSDGVTVVWGNIIGGTGNIDRLGGLDLQIIESELAVLVVEPAIVGRVLES